MKLNILLLLSLLGLLASCNGQTSVQQSQLEPFPIGDTVTELGSNIMVIHQDKQNVYWFGSWETGLYRYDGKTLRNLNSQHGLPSNKIHEIKEDTLGNLYFASFYDNPSITKFNGNRFEKLIPVADDHWELNPADLWFRHTFENNNIVYRYDGLRLHELRLPQPPNLPNPFGIYSIYKDSKGNIWFGTNPVGVCRYDGKSFEWITEEDVTEFRDEGANGVRSIAEDQNGDFWFNTEFRYGIYDSATLNSDQFYTRHKSIGGLDGKPDSDLDEYLSVVCDDDQNLWFVTYRDGVWKYDGTKIRHYVVEDQSKAITLFSIYKDNNGELWLGTHENGAYKFNGSSFEKFRM